METLIGKEALSRRIKVIEDLVTLCDFQEPSRRAKKQRWLEFEDAVDADLKEEEKASLLEFSAD